MNYDGELDENKFSNKRIQKYQEITLKNPFFRDEYYWDKNNETYDKIKVKKLHHSFTKIA